MYGYNIVQSTACSLSFRKRQKLVNLNNGASHIVVLDRERRTSFLALKPTIDEIHDRTENEENTENKVSMKNVLYEPGKINMNVISFYMHIQDIIL